MVLRLYRSPPNSSTRVPERWSRSSAFATTGCLEALDEPPAVKTDALPDRTKRWTRTSAPRCGPRPTWRCPHPALRRRHQAARHPPRRPAPAQLPASQFGEFPECIEATSHAHHGGARARRTGTGWIIHGAAEGSSAVRLRGRVAEQVVERVLDHVAIGEVADEDLTQHSAKRDRSRRLWACRPSWPEPRCKTIRRLGPFGTPSGTGPIAASAPAR